MIARKMLMAIAEALIVYGLIIVGYGILVIHITQTWSGDWHVDRNLPAWFTLDTFVMLSFAVSFFWVHNMALPEIHRAHYETGISGAHIPSGLLETLKLRVYDKLTYDTEASSTWIYARYRS